jgi:hypothetical protein
MIHWTVAEKASIERASGEKPPVGSVVSGWSTALYSPMLSARPARWALYSNRNSTTVNAR